MKILGILGSPREGGNTDILLDNALRGAQDGGATTEKIVLNELKISPCQECGGCDKTGICIIKDDMHVLYEKIYQADGIIVASPIFFGSLSAQTKIMIDRGQALWIRKYVLKQRNNEKVRKGIFIAAGATDRQDFFDNAKSIIKNFFNTINVNYTGELFCPNVAEKGKVLKNKKCCDEAYGIGSELA